ncbi:fasciclin domain-containing protein [Nostocoides sp.]|jgi:uncharacterized surface protein with fasciclin (FAS1) repeats|uniref:fasciclin domain-containing protein n=1 Tax=Nostocoides sp. TaxID=1917966 RepID=UPI002B72C819|nr:fasciclin domain-containing protein [Tetrasphaera sp.]
MSHRRITAVALGSALAASLALPASAAAASENRLGNRSLAAVLTSDGNTFDRNWNDYDIVTEAVLAVIANDSDGNSPVRLLADGSVALTAFVPSDLAFRNLVQSLTGKRLDTEQKVFAAAAGLGLETVEAVLLYHVIPGATITKAMAVKANGANLTTALGSTVGVRVYNRAVPVIELRDKDMNAANAFVNPFATDLNKGNRQIAHGITAVLRPVDL